jgi:hypothetical protein
MSFRKTSDARPVTDPKSSIENSVPLMATPEVVIGPPVSTPKVDIRAWMPVG